MKHIIITDVKFMEVDRDPWELVSRCPPYQQRIVWGDSGEETVNTDTIRELIHGRRFRRSDGTMLLIGCSKQAQEVIGIQYEAWENSEKMLEDYRRCWNNTERKMIAIREMSFWQRLRFAFTGKIE